MHIATKSSIKNITEEISTAKLAIKISNLLKIGDIIFLYGEIGVGKTTFVRHLINNLQKKNNLLLTEVTSPTFNIVNEYQLGELVIHHYDLFRIKNEKELINIGLFENHKDIITLIEWPEKIKKKPGNIINLSFKYEENSEKRFLKISGIDEKKLNELI